MAIYECISYDKEGQRNRIKLELESEEELTSYAEKYELKIINIKKIKTKKLNKVKNKELSIMCQQLGMLLSSGCEITQSLNTIKSNCNKKLQSILNNIDYQLKQGNSISSSFQQTGTFSNFFINMIKAGEISGRVDEILLNLHQHYKKEHEFKQKLITALIYPMILVVAIVVVTIFMIVFVIPKFETSFASTGTSIPISTKIMIDISKFIRQYYQFLIIIFLALISSCYVYISKSERARINIEEKLFNIKRIGNIIQTIEISKFNRSFYILMSSGIHIVDALEISSKVIGNKYMYNKLYISKESIEKGCNISDSLYFSGVFPDMFISMLKVGEETGNIDKCLHTIMINDENNMDNVVQKIAKIIEPAIVASIGIVVAVIILPIMNAIFDAVKAF